MSIITKRGDDGQTDLLFGRRVPKTDIAVVTTGTVDELNAALGVARAAGLTAPASDLVSTVQAKLIGLMGEFATLEEDQPLYDEKGYARILADDVAWLEGEAKAREADWDVRFKGWVMPGKDSTLGSAHLDVARTVCRRAELAVITFEDATFPRTRARLFLNRLSDLLWILARGENLKH